MICFNKNAKNDHFYVQGLTKLILLNKSDFLNLVSNLHETMDYKKFNGLILSNTIF